MKDKLTLTCSCGCDNGISFKVLDGNIYVSTVSSDFYTAQNNTFYNFVESLKDINLIRKHIRPVLKEICLNKEDIETLYNYLEKIYPDMKEETDFENISKIKVTKTTMEDIDYEDYSINILLTSTQIRNIFRYKYRCYELVLGKNEVEELMKSCKKILK